MTASKEPDYTRYSLEQLERARRSIDVERFPERTKILDILIADRKLRAAEAPVPPQTAPEPENAPWFRRRKATFEFKSRSQVVLAAAGTIVIGGGGAALMLLQDLSDRSVQIFLFMWVASTLFNLGHLLLEYRRLGSAEQPTGTKSNPVSPAPPQTTTPPAATSAEPPIMASHDRAPQPTLGQRPRNPNSSPIQRL